MSLPIDQSNTPKYTVVFDPNVNDSPYIVMVHTLIYDGGTNSQKFVEVKSVRYTCHSTLEAALRQLAYLSPNPTMVVAYSTQPAYQGY
jgi:hypothetical protein